LALAAPSFGASAPKESGRDGLFRDDMDRTSLEESLARSLEFLRRAPSDRVLSDRPRKITVREVRESLLTFRSLLHLWKRPELLAREIRSRFEVHDAVEGEGRADVLFTGYYQPVIEASLTETTSHKFPIYRRPTDLVEAEVVTLKPQPRAEKVVGRPVGDSLVPYYSRDEIDGADTLRGRGYEIAWAKDPVDLFFLHVQGSGVLRLEDGRSVYVGYAANNGRPYKSIGRFLAESGKIPAAKLSMQALRRYLVEHPEERKEIFAHNESYVFFRVVREGPLGSLDVKLTAGRSIATDLSLFPKGALAFVSSRRPIVDAKGNLQGWRPFSRFVLNQDSGSAIRGPARADLFFGTGQEAGHAAGAMNVTGKLYFLLKKKTTP
jgi:membrane-bound lytic murein transglycosylase A